mgnify:CR=1 FL=1
MRIFWNSSYDKGHSDAFHAKETNEQGLQVEIFIINQNLHII